MTISSGMWSLADNTSGGSIHYRSSKVAVNMVMRSAANRTCSSRDQLCAGQPGLGPNGHGRSQCYTAMCRPIEGLEANDSGKFYSYDGREYAWRRANDHLRILIARRCLRQRTSSEHRRAGLLKPYGFRGRRARHPPAPGVFGHGRAASTSVQRGVGDAILSERLQAR